MGTDLELSRIVQGTHQQHRRSISLGSLKSAPKKPAIRNTRTQLNPLNDARSHRDRSRKKVQVTTRPATREALARRKRHGAKIRFHSTCVELYFSESEPVVTVRRSPKTKVPLRESRPSAESSSNRTTTTLEEARLHRRMEHEERRRQFSAGANERLRRGETLAVRTSKGTGAFVGDYPDDVGACVVSRESALCAVRCAAFGIAGTMISTEPSAASAASILDEQQPAQVRKIFQFAPRAETAWIQVEWCFRASAFMSVYVLCVCVHQWHKGLSASY